MVIFNSYVTNYQRVTKTSTVLFFFVLETTATIFKIGQNANDPHQLSEMTLSPAPSETPQQRSKEVNMRLFPFLKRCPTFG